VFFSEQCIMYMGMMNRTEQLFIKSKEGDAEKARTENAAPKCRGGNGENGKVGK